MGGFLALMAPLNIFSTRCPLLSTRYIEIFEKWIHPPSNFLWWGSPYRFENPGGCSHRRFEFGAPASTLSRLFSVPFPVSTIKQIRQLSFSFPPMTFYQAFFRMAFMPLFPFSFERTLKDWKPVFLRFCNLWSIQTSPDNSSPNL